MNSETPLTSSSTCELNEPTFNKLVLKLDVSRLLQLKKYFFSSSKLSNDKEILQIDEGRFINAINSIYGHSDYNLQALKLFQSFDKDRSSFISWKQLLDQLLEFAKSKTEQRTNSDILIQKSRIKIEELKHCKKEPIAIIIPIETYCSFCYVAISKHGKVGLYDGKFSFLTEYDLFFIRTGVNRRVKDIWITAAVYLQDCKSLIITASDKSMMIYDVSTLCHITTFFITGMTNIPMCLSYKESDHQNANSYLVIGDDLGGLTTITFKQPKTSLFHKKVQDKLSTYFWIELHGGLNEQFCKIQINRRIHTRPVKKVVHIKHNSIISCSTDPDASVVIKHCEGIRDPYIFKIPRGATCFYYSESLKILCTGGSDSCVRLWEPAVTFKPSAVLPAQHFKIVDVVVLAHMCVVLSFNKNGVLKVWNIFDYSCIQSINLRFPSFGLLEKPVQFGLQSFYCGAGREHNLLSNKTIKTNSSTSTKVDVSLITTNDDYVEFNRWCRPEIIVACTHVAIIPLDDWLVAKKETINSINKEYMKRDNCLLPPPQKMHNPRRPSIWDNKKVESECASSVDNSIITNLSTDYKCYKENLLEKNYLQPSLDDLLKNMGLYGIMEKDFLAGTRLKHNMNTKFAMQHSKQEEMMIPVSQNAPFTALDLYDCADIKFSFPLPISERMKQRSGLDNFTTPQQMLKYSKSDSYLLLNGYSQNRYSGQRPYSIDNKKRLIKTIT